MTNDEIHQRFDLIEDTLQEMNRKFDSVRDDISTVKEVVEVWNAAKVGGKFVRWSMPILAAIGTAWFTVKGWIFK